MNLRVRRYRLSWDVDQGEGTVVLLVSENYQDEYEVTLTGLLAPSFSVLTDLLRHEKPLFWDPTRKALYTGDEAPGQGDGPGGMPHLRLE